MPQDIPARYQQATLEYISSRSNSIKHISSRSRSGSASRWWGSRPTGFRLGAACSPTPASPPRRDRTGGCALGEGEAYTPYCALTISPALSFTDIMSRGVVRIGFARVSVFPGRALHETRVGPQGSTVEVV